jgi:hypothetical protein
MHKPALHCRLHFHENVAAGVSFWTSSIVSLQNMRAIVEQFLTEGSVRRGWSSRLTLRRSGLILKRVHFCCDCRNRAGVGTALENHLQVDEKYKQE